MEAFVALAFEGDPWNDKRYLVIEDVLAEAGYTAIRADQIRTSGAVMSEVAERLKVADLVVVDISDQSHNVTYELGFCHGASRDPSSLILLCRHDSLVPFNYRHFRRIAYKDLRHLRRLLRHQLDISVPLHDSQLAAKLVFDLKPDAGWYGSDIARAVLHGISSLQFSGRCEYYAADDPAFGFRKNVVAIGLRPPRRKAKLKYKDWKTLMDRIGERVNQTSDKVEYDDIASEIIEVYTARRALLPRGAVEFEDGAPVRVLNPDSGDSDSPFCGEVWELLGRYDHDD